jgi:hypothetical protein
MISASMHPDSPRGRLTLVSVSLLVSGTLALAAAAPAPAQQRPDRVPAPGATRNGTTLESEHFRVVYDPARLAAAHAEEARSLAEAAWVKCARLFKHEPARGIRLDLTPNFTGATGFAIPVPPNNRDPNARPQIGVRYADLEYLGLSGEYVLTHEIAHVFSGPLAGTSLGEGIADWAAGSFAGVQQRPWWAKTLRRGGLWIEPDAFFVTGEFDQGPEVEAIIRTAQYAESGLLVAYLVERFGWEKFATFALEYGKARGPLESNAARAGRGRPGQEARGERERPDVEQVSAVFHKHFGSAAAKVLADWLAWTEQSSEPPADAEKLLLAERIYGAVRNYELWLVRQRPGPGAEARRMVREAFTKANRALAAGNLGAARAAFARARGYVDSLRRPASVALNRAATNWRETESNWRHARGRLGIGAARET